MNVSVIVSTYNSPEWLARSLWGLAAQSARDFEIVVADDGSTPDTRDVIEAFRADSGLAVQHIWHADEGFRKCRILNRGILAARGDYLVFTDGDCIPRQDFLAAHIALARPNTFLSGGYVKLPLPTSQAIGREHIESGEAFNLDWLQSHGLRRTRKHLKLTASATTARLMNALTTTRASWNGHNASTWASTARLVNGFDERLHYGGEDREFGERLIHAGVRSRQIRFSAVCVHLDHPRDYVRTERVDEARQIRGETQVQRATRAQIGLAELESDESEQAPGSAIEASPIRAPLEPVGNSHGP